MTVTKKTRKSVSLDSRQLELIRSMAVHNSAERQASEALLGKLPDSLSESQAISALIDIAQNSLREMCLDRGYEQLADSFDTEDAAFEVAQRRRRDKRERHRNDRGSSGVRDDV